MNPVSSPRRTMDESDGVSASARVCEVEHDAVFYAPGARVFHGPDEIGAFYEAFLATTTPQIRIATCVENGAECVYELEARTAGETGYRLGAIDHATVNADGKITRFAVYTK